MQKPSETSACCMAMAMVDPRTIRKPWSDTSRRSRKDMQKPRTTSVLSTLMVVACFKTIAPYGLGKLCKHGRGVPVDYSRALKRFIKAAEQGDVDPQYEIGLLLEYFEKDDDAAEPE
ncbi:hypothetical protein KI688_006546 [Linnemannia hyalina]|uniref:Uncharacterized protein n=1 Tax=Linnemannia hyalina TaxID=64524 RepID=A0A9P8BMY7_9FUNG|nr:hypothetical protein KI688_006546 [Linnemannia hyalina]